MESDPQRNPSGSISKVKPIRLPERGPAEIYHCWDGKITSPTKSLLVSLPVVAEDIQALELVRSCEFYKEIGLRQMTQRTEGLQPYDFTYAYDVLKEQFPGSYYTYVAGLYKQEVFANASIGILEELIQLQPNHPLSEQAYIQLAQNIQKFPEYPFRTDPSQLKLPTIMNEYIDQVKREKRGRLTDLKNHQ